MEPTPGIVFEELMDELHAEGFVLTLHDHLEFTAIFRSFAATNTGTNMGMTTGTREQLKYYLAPIVCKNPEEQERFYAAWDRCGGALAERGSGEEWKRPAGRREGWHPVLRSFFRWFLIGMVLTITLRLALHHKRHVPLVDSPDIEVKPDSAVAEAPAAVRHSGRVFVVKPIKHSTATIDEGEKSRIIAYGQPFEKEVSLPTSLIGRLLVLGGVFLALSTTFIPQKRHKYLPKVDLDEPDGDDLLTDLPHPSHDYLIQRHPVLSTVSRNLLRPVSTDLVRLNIPQTIRTSIHTYGLLTPVYTPVERKPEYLVLIDRTDPLFTPLFRYLTGVLAGDSVPVSYYFFEQADKFYPERGNRVLNMHALRERHSNAQLIVMGLGHSLLQDGSGGYSPEALSVWSHWEHRLLLTPLRVVDQGGEEYLLSGQFLLLPADIENCLSIPQHLFEEDPEGKLATERKGGYEVGHRRLSTIEGIRTYLGNEDLFQWMCALALYPVVKWEVLLAIGAAVLEERKASLSLQYTHLLQLTRIVHANGGRLPVELRVALLRQLDEGAELAARRAILTLLQQSEGLAGADSPEDRARLVQQYTQSFVLYGHEPRKNKEYEADARKFMAIWDRRRVADLATVIYLQNEGRQWSTPLRSMEDPSRQVGAERFLDELLALKVIHDPRIRRGFRNAAMACWLALGLLFLFKDDIAGTAVDRVLGLMDQDYTNHPILVTIPLDDCVRQQANRGQLRVTLLNYDNNQYRKTFSIVGKDSLRVEFADVTMAGKDTAKAAFQLILGQDLTVDCPYKEFYSRYRLQIGAADCPTGFRPNVEEKSPRPKGSDEQ